MQSVNDGVMVIMGYGTEAYIDKIKEMISTLNLQEKVRFVPPVAHHEVVKYAASADIGVVPIQNACKSYYYCSPNKLFESMMAGLPVAASDFPEMRRVIEESQCGRLFDPSKPDEIADVLNNMIRDDSAKEEMRKNALKHAHKYSWEQESKKLLSIYSDLSSS
jgi:glycosyltransferase involved in cell wall biosynthesis